MGFDGFNFSSNWQGERTKFKQDIAIICHCGKATKTHSIKQLRSCKNEKNTA
jgi:hypothetical protein